ncbi:hypothetical protein [Aestuariivita boseongensis]|uniref:hypothetical protein n=1 Tax=Aestuariivita boseongensis TaxID=1470562 RepID=UPI0006818D7B|nr:hypothetical protein [Aestuariivita boseongensis]
MKFTKKEFEETFTPDADNEHLFHNMLMCAKCGKEPRHTNDRGMQFRYGYNCLAELRKERGVWE